MTGAETLSVRDIAHEFGKQFGDEPTFAPGTEGGSALLNDAAKARGLFGEPKVGTRDLIGWIADWIRNGGALLNKPTHFQTRDGRF
jgi:hypothetical protein